MSRYTSNKTLTELLTRLLETVSKNLPDAIASAPTSEMREVVKESLEPLAMITKDKDVLNFILDIMTVLIERTLPHIKDEYPEIDAQYFESAVASFLTAAAGKLLVAYKEISTFSRQTSLRNKDYFICINIGMIVEAHTDNFVHIFEIIRESQNRRIAIKVSPDKSVLDELEKSFGKS